MKKVAIVQSNYIPWKGYFDLINLVDEFVLFDDMQYTKRDWRNRNRIKTANGLAWLSIPLQVKGKYHQKIKDAVIADLEWNRQHWKTIVQNYSRAKYFSTYEEFFEDLYLGSNERFLSQVNFRFIAGICEILGSRTKISWSMDYELSGEKTERLVELCRKIGATEYITGPAAKNYIEESMFADHGIALRYMDYSGYPQYSQLFPPFEHAVSIIDLIFNVGSGATKFMKSF